MQNVWNAVWDVWCGLECVLWDSVMCNLTLNVVMCLAWCEVVCGRDVEWCAEMWWYDLMRIMVRCEMCVWCDVECRNFRHGVIKMQNVWCGIWRGVECIVPVCGMLHNAKNVESYDVMWNVVVWNCGDEECGIGNVVWYHMWMWWCDVKSRHGGVMRCGTCGVKYAVMLNVGVVWNSCGCGMVCDVEHVLQDMMWNGVAQADCSVMWSQM